MTGYWSVWADTRKHWRLLALFSTEQEARKRFSAECASRKSGKVKLADADGKIVEVRMVSPKRTLADILADMDKAEAEGRSYIPGEEE